MVNCCVNLSEPWGVVGLEIWKMARRMLLLLKRWVIQLNDPGGLSITDGFRAQEYPRFVYPFVHRHFDCLHVLAIVNNVAMNKGLQIFLSQIL